MLEEWFMSKPPRLVVDAHDEWKIRASFPNGRYRFSLQSSAVTLLRDELGYRKSDIVPWRLLRILVYTGDAWLPDTSGAVAIAEDLSEPDRAVALPDADAETLANYLRGQRYSSAVREALTAEIRATALDRFLSPSELQKTEAWVEKTSALLEHGHSDDAADTADASDTIGVSVLHVGRVTLGRRNMGRAVRIPDYQAAFEQAIDIAMEHDVDAVVQTGGLFQSRSPSQSVIRAGREQLERLDAEGIPCYSVFGRQEIEAKNDHVEQLCADGLLTSLGGRTVTLEDGVVLHGVDGSDTHRESAPTIADDASFVVSAVGEANATAPYSNLFDAVDRQAPAPPELYLCGRRTEPAWSKRDGVPVVDPGATEHVLSKTTFDETPAQRGVYEYTIQNGDFAVTRHALTVRDFETVRVELTTADGLEAVQRQVAVDGLAETAVLAKLEGEKTTASVGKGTVQEWLENHAYCARVYDERTLRDEPATSSPGAGSTASERFDGIPVDESTAAYVSALDDVSELEFAALSRGELIDLYAGCSMVRSRAEAIRTAVRDVLVEAVPAGDTASGRVGSIESHRRESTSPKEKAEIFDALDEHGIPREWVLSQQFDAEMLEKLVEDTDTELAESDVYETSVLRYVTREDFDLNP